MIKENYSEVLNLYKYFVSALYSVTRILEIAIFHEIEVYIERVKWTRSASPGQLNVWINSLLRGIPSHTIWLGCYLFSLQSHLSIDCTGISKHYLVSFPGASFLIGAIAFCDTTTFRKHSSPKGRLNSLFGYPQCPSMLLVKTWYFVVLRNGMFAWLYC